MTAASGSPPQGELTLFPLVARSELTIAGLILAGVLPWHSPAAVGAVTHPPGDVTNQTVVIAYEWPVPYWTTLDGDFKQTTVERLHLDRYCTDVLLATGQLPYESLAIGANPPDLVGTLADGSQIGVDAAQLTVSGRIAAQAQFERIRRAILAEPRGDFAHLHGYVLYLWFETEDGLGLPHRRAAAVDEVVAALRVYKPNTAWLELSSKVLPEHLRGMDMQTTATGCSFYAAEMKNAAPTTTFFARTGFEMALAFQTEHAFDEAWRELARLVQRHDKPEIQDLVVTVGGPNQRGVAYRSDEILLSAALRQGPPPLAPRHLKSVVLHTWSNGSITRVFPSFDAFPASFPGGYVVSHLARQPLAEPEVAMEPADGESSQAHPSPSKD